MQAIQKPSLQDFCRKVMAPCKLFFIGSLTCLFFFSLSSPSNGSTFSSLSSQPKVDLSLYYETLCPYCANFIVNNLTRIFHNGLISIINLRLIPWGNAFALSNNTIVCQHGANECVLNTVEACIIDVWPNPGEHFKLIECIESFSLARIRNPIATCFRRRKLDFTPVQDCYNSKKGIKLELQYGDETNHLNPPHQYVPWILVDNYPLKNDYQNFITHVCQAYKAQPVPAACRSTSLSVLSTENPKRNNGVCYANDLVKD